MKIIVGLGNIGEKYLTTRHNVGFIALDHFLSSNNLDPKWKEESKLKAITTKVPYKDQVLFLAKPTTLMNLSGQAVTKILHFFKEPLSSLIVIYDDIDLPLGTIRIREKGSAGTHNGMKSIIQELGSEDFTRIRVGIESRGELSPQTPNLSSFVLGKFNEKEIPLVKESLDQTNQTLDELL